MDGNVEPLVPAAVRSGRSTRWRALIGPTAVALYLIATWLVANASLNVQSLVLVAAVFGILAISLDLVAGMLGLYSLGQGGFFAIGAYLTTILAGSAELNVFALLPSPSSFRERPASSSAPCRCG